jgi:hypothetical protein
MSKLSLGLIIGGIGEILLSLGLQAMPIHHSWWLSGGLCSIGVILILVGIVINTKKRQEPSINPKAEDSNKNVQRSIESKLQNKLIQFRKCLVNLANNLKKDEVDMNKVEEALKYIDDHDKELMKFRGYPTEHPEAMIYVALNTCGVGTDWLIQRHQKANNLWNTIESLKSSVEPELKSLISSYTEILNMAVSQILFLRYTDFTKRTAQGGFAPFTSKVTLFETLDGIESRLHKYIKQIKGKK